MTPGIDCDAAHAVSAAPLKPEAAVEGVAPPIDPSTGAPPKPLSACSTYMVLSRALWEGDWGTLCESVSDLLSEDRSIHSHESGLTTLKATPKPATLGFLVDLNHSAYRGYFNTHKEYHGRN